MELRNFEMDVTSIFLTKHYEGSDTEKIANNKRLAADGKPSIYTNASNNSKRHTYQLIGLLETISEKFKSHHILNYLITAKLQISKTM